MIMKKDDKFYLMASMQIKAIFPSPDDDEPDDPDTTTGGGGKN